MGYINLPDIEQITLEKDPKKQMEMMLNTMGLLMKSLTELNGYINSKNVKEITADKISAGTINTGEITIGTGKNGSYYRIDDDGIVANNGSVNTMLFDLATGLMTLTSVLVQSAAGSYPRIVMDPESDLFGAYAAADKYISVEALRGLGGSPALVFRDGSIPLTCIVDIDTINQELFISSNKNIQISTMPSGEVRIYGSLVRFSSWSNIYSTSNAQTLQQALSNKATAGAATNQNGAHNHGIPDGTKLMVEGGGTVTYFSAGSHAHNQT